MAPKTRRRSAACLVAATLTRWGVGGAPAPARAPADGAGAQNRRWARRTQHGDRGHGHADSEDERTPSLVGSPSDDERKKTESREQPDHGAPASERRDERKQTKASSEGTRDGS